MVVCENPSNWADCEIFRPAWHQQLCHTQNSCLSFQFWHSVWSSHY